MSAPPILLLRSSNRNFPLDLLPVLRENARAAQSLPDLAAYIAAPERSQPFLAVFEVGSTPDLERALLAYEWSERLQPLAPARYLLLLASKNLSLGDRAGRFGSTEVAVLPQPPRNLLFKLELQAKLLAKEKPRATGGEGFAARYEPDASGRQRVLVLRGQSELDGKWSAAGDTPSGKVRWRWVKNPARAPATAAGRAYEWQAESTEAPRFDRGLEAWVVEDADAELSCTHEGEELYRAAPGNEAPVTEVAESLEARVISSAEADASAGGAEEIAGEPLSTAAPDTSITQDPLPEPGAIFTEEKFFDGSNRAHAGARQGIGRDRRVAARRRFGESWARNFGAGGRASIRARPWRGDSSHHRPGGRAHGTGFVARARAGHSFRPIATGRHSRPAGAPCRQGAGGPRPPTPGSRGHRLCATSAGRSPTRDGE